ncbi:MAG: 3-keto-steroid reductase [Phylliscum demangeonii]|nr:MAG: 3-keto-steroid reductase [Phylliscum demangeonii]
MEKAQEETFTVLVTGVNSGLGFAICVRLIDEFLHTRPKPSQTLHLVLTTRTARKAHETDLRLRQHLRALSASIPSVDDRVTVQFELVDLTALVTVRALARKLCGALTTLDAVVLNAGTGAFTGVDWWAAGAMLVRDYLTALTWPTYMKARVGDLTNRQLTPWSSSAPLEEGEERQEEPLLGDVFCANVFGHYLLVHGLTPLLSASISASLRGATSGAGGRIIWVSSIGAHAKCFSLDDLQGVRAAGAYESSKRLTDLLALTASSRSTQAWVTPFLTPHRNPPVDAAAAARATPHIYLAHPGICATSMVPVPGWMSFFHTLSLYLARWLFASPWHNVQPYSGACAPVWLVLALQPTLDALEDAGPGGSGSGSGSGSGPRKGKWGSACDFWGRERVVRTEVEGWGYAGVVGGEHEERDETKAGGGAGGRGRRTGRNPDAQRLTDDARRRFEDEGRQCWRDMEALREMWEATLDERS